jgi:hypothetical protein
MSKFTKFVAVLFIVAKVEYKCRLSGYSTHLIINYFTYQSGFVFCSERSPIGIGNGTIRSS